MTVNRSRAGGVLAATPARTSLQRGAARARRYWSHPGAIPTDTGRFTRRQISRARRSHPPRSWPWPWANQVWPRATALPWPMRWPLNMARWVTQQPADLTSWIGRRPARTWLGGAARLALWAGAMTGTVMAGFASFVWAATVGTVATLTLYPAVLAFHGTALAFGYSRPGADHTPDQWDAWSAHLMDTQVLPTIPPNPDLQVGPWATTMAPNRPPNRLKGLAVAAALIATLGLLAHFTAAGTVPQPAPWEQIQAKATGRP